MFEETHFLPTAHTTVLHGTGMLRGHGSSSSPSSPSSATATLLVANRRQMLGLRAASGDCWLEDLKIWGMPPDAEIISADAFFPPQSWAFPGSTSTSPIAGVVLHQAAVGGSSGGGVKRATSFFHIYGTGMQQQQLSPLQQGGVGDDLGRILAQPCQRIKLGFVPLQLTHATMYYGSYSGREDERQGGVGVGVGGGGGGAGECGGANADDEEMRDQDEDGEEEEETVFLLCGDDGRVHIFRRNPDTLQFYEVRPGEDPELLPELQALGVPSNVTSLHVCNEGGHRITALGFQNGRLQVAVTPTGAGVAGSASLPTTTTTLVSSLQIDGPLTSVRLFPRMPPILQGGAGMSSSPSFSGASSSSSSSSSLSSSSSFSSAAATGSILGLCFGVEGDSVADASGDSRGSGGSGSSVGSVGVNGIPPMQLAVGGAIGYAAVYDDVTHMGLRGGSTAAAAAAAAGVGAGGRRGGGSGEFDGDGGNATSVRGCPPQVLPGSMDCDSVLCVHAADLDLDGTNEVVVGTYGSDLIVFSEVSEGGALEAAATASRRGAGGTGGLGGLGGGRGRSSRKHRRSRLVSGTLARAEYQVDWQRRFPCPIYGIQSGDVNLDGVDELFITTTHGIHVLQPDLGAAADKVVAGLAALKELAQLEAEVEQELQKIRAGPKETTGAGAGESTGA